MRWRRFARRMTYWAVWIPAGLFLLCLAAYRLYPATPSYLFLAGYGFGLWVSNIFNAWSD